MTTNATDLKDYRGRSFQFPELPGSPNLDAHTAEELITFWALAYAHPVIVARRLFPHRPAGYVRATETLSYYANNKATAMRCRENGKIQTALVYEHACDISYDRLPDWAKW